MTTAIGKARTGVQILGPYRTPRISRSILELLVTAVPFVMLWPLMWAALGVGYWLCLLLAFPTACFLMRLFMIQHDCSHGACFRRRATNDWVGRVVGVVRHSHDAARARVIRNYITGCPAIVIIIALSTTTGAFAASGQGMTGPCGRGSPVAALTSAQPTREQ